MKVTVLGTGNAFSTENGNVCYLLEEDGRRMLIDAGWALPYMLKRHGVDIKTIDDIYISHLHAEHVGGLEYIAFSRYDWMSKPRSWEDNNSELRMGGLLYPITGISTYSTYAPNLIAHEDLIVKLWDKTVRGGLESMEGFKASIDTYFVPNPIEPNQPFDWQGWVCELVQQVHIMTGSVISWTFGLFMQKPGHKSIYFVTDSQHCSPIQIEVFYKKADVVFQDCELIGVDTKNKKMNFKSGVHANYGQLASFSNANAVTLSNETKAKMWLTHYQDFLNYNKDFYGNDVDWQEYSKKDGFQGFLVPGQEFEF